MQIGTNICENYLTVSNKAEDACMLWPRIQGLGIKLRNSCILVSGHSWIMYMTAFFHNSKKLGTIKFPSIIKCTLTYGLFLHMDDVEKWK